MKLFKKSILVASVAVAASSGSVSAAQFNNVEILRVGCNVDSSACSLFVDTDVSSSAAGCTGNGTRVNFNSASAGGKNILASALTAKAAGFTVNLTISDSSCAGANPALVALTAN